MAKGFLRMSAKEIDRADTVRRVLEKRLTQAKAASLMGLSVRQVKRLCRGYKGQGIEGLVSRQRGRPSNRKLSDDIQAYAVQIVRQRYGDFGPKLAHEKLVEIHGVRVGRETLRKWLIEAGVWITRVERAPRAHQPRNRRQCLGELVQIDGSHHAWFEERGLDCALLVYVDDATGRLMELRFAKTESAFDYFDSTVAYLGRHGRPAAFYSDKHSIFRVHREGTSGRAGGVSQFGRALQDLNIDIICANSPQAKGRVERMNKTLQDRLVKELRLRGISTMEAGNAFMPEFMADYNRRFERAAVNPHDAHRPLQPGQNLARIFTWQEHRTLTRNLAVHFKRVTYLVEPNPVTLDLGRRGVRVNVHEAADGTVELLFDGASLPYSVLDQQPYVDSGQVVENKRLGAVLSLIQAGQAKRDEQRLASRKLTIRQKDRLREAQQRAQSGYPVAASHVPLSIETSMERAKPGKQSPSALGSDETPEPFVPASQRGDRLEAMTAFMERFEAEQKAKRKKYSEAANQKKRDRDLQATMDRVPA